MVGQEHVLQALTNALDSNRLHHAYLFSGTRGVGKTTIARIFAKSLNCEQGIGSEPCGECASCSEIDQGRSVDLIEIDAASRTGVEDMRELLDNVQYAPTRSRFKIYLIDEVHMLSRHSFNALLKTLEEPPPHIKFLLATTDPQKMPVTVLSRCLQFNLKRMSRAQILSQLQYLTEQEGITAQETALVQLASAADGSMRDALSLLDQAIGYGGGEVQQVAVDSMLGSISRDYLERLLDALSDQQAAAILKEARQIIEHSPDYQRVCAEMISLLQQVALYQSDPKLVSEDEFSAQMLQKYSRRWSPEEIQLYYQILLQGRQDLLICPDEAAGFEMLMLRLIAFSPRSDSEPEPDEIKKKPDAIVSSEKPEPVQPEPAHPEPAQPEPVQPEPVQPEPVQPEPVQPEPVQPEPVQPELVQPELVQPAPGNRAPDSVSPGESGDSVLDWSAMAYALGLTGLAQEIVANSQLRSHAGERIQLQLPTELFELVNDVTRAEILQALEHKLGVSLRLELTATAALVGETPLQAKLRREQEERVAAIAAIREEVMVKKLQHAFAAELDETSVVKIESNG
jgi:DNA polymerase-3 subunit gamma/tau